MITRWEMTGRALASLMTPRVANAIRAGRPGAPVLARVIAARSDPGPLSWRFVTRIVRAYDRAGCPGAPGCA